MPNRSPVEQRGDVCINALYLVLGLCHCFMRKDTALCFILCSVNSRTDCFTQASINSFLRVISQPDLEKPVYTVVPVDGSQAPKNIHRMELRPCGPEQGPFVVVQDWRTSMDTGRSTTLMDADEDELGAVWVVRQHPQRGPSPESPPTREAELSLSVSGVREKGSSEPLLGISSSSESDQAELEVPPGSPVQPAEVEEENSGETFKSYPIAKVCGVEPGGGRGGLCLG
ncbi:hypothetical protein DPEC_G00188130 [Dallia pectoralis]|uniref:Uncharacterized protein n=1 Tax=Dallia pectoralis TaxID=75939 RepID=A0ACC2GC82_DALPE|nr:hypothetical protein DPEC_G00188130 [Dallia pectoralis]